MAVQQLLVPNDKYHRLLDIAQKYAKLKEEIENKQSTSEQENEQTFSDQNMTAEEQTKTSKQQEDTTTPDQPKIPTEIVPPGIPAKPSKTIKIKRLNFKKKNISKKVPVKWQNW